MAADVAKGYASCVGRAGTRRATGRTSPGSRRSRRPLHRMEGSKEGGGLATSFGDASTHFPWRRPSTSVLLSGSRGSRVSSPRTRLYGGGLRRLARMSFVWWRRRRRTPGARGRPAALLRRTARPLSSHRDRSPHIVRGDSDDLQPVALSRIAVCTDSSLLLSGAAADNLGVAIVLIGTALDGDPVDTRKTSVDIVIHACLRAGLMASNVAAEPCRVRQRLRARSGSRSRGRGARSTSTLASPDGVRREPRSGRSTAARNRRANNDRRASRRHVRPGECGSRGGRRVRRRRPAAGGDRARLSTRGRLYRPGKRMEGASRRRSTGRSRTFASEAASAVSESSGIDEAVETISTRARSGDRSPSRSPSATPHEQLGGSSADASCSTTRRSSRALGVERDRVPLPWEHMVSDSSSGLRQAGKT